MRDLWLQAVQSELDLLTDSIQNRCPPQTSVVGGLQFNDNKTSCKPAFRALGLTLTTEQFSDVVNAVCGSRQDVPLWSYNEWATAEFAKRPDTRMMDNNDFAARMRFRRGETEAPSTTAENNRPVTVVDQDEEEDFPF